MEHSGLVEIAEGREVILTHEDVRIPKWRQRFWINGIIQLLWTKMKLKFWKKKFFGVSAESLSSFLSTPLWSDP